MGKIEEKLLSDFRKANKTRKESLAIKFGFSNAAEYENYLLEEVAILVGKIVNQITVKPVIHIVNLLDNSGSMRGAKFDNAYRAIEQEIKDLQKEESVKYIYSLYNFGAGDVPSKSVERKFIEDVKIPNMTTNFNTPLYATIGLLANDIIGSLNPIEKVLVKIFTDGQNNCQNQLEANAIEAIKELQSKGVTVTFVGTKPDVSYIQSIFGIDESNTLIHDNTGKGVAESFEKTRGATIEYTKNVVAGKDVSRGFYKNIK